MCLGTATNKSPRTPGSKFPLSSIGKLFLKSMTKNFHVLRWIHKAWEEITADLVVNAFKQCSKSNPLEGNEDEVCGKKNEL